MRSFVVFAGLALACGGCAQLAPPEVGPAEAAVVMPAPQPDCRDITTTATIDGKQQEVHGRACRAPDGSWQIVAPPFGSEQPIYLVPPYAYAYDPGWWWWPPFGLGVVADFAFLHVPHEHFRRFHDRDRDFFPHDHMRHFDGGFFGGMRRG